MRTYRAHVREVTFERITKMKRQTRYIATLVVSVLVIVSCSTVSKIIKSGDPQYAYEQALELYNEEKWDKASSLFEACRHIYVGSPREDSLTFYNAHCKFKDRKWSEASSLFDEHRRKFSRSPFIEDVEGMYALCYFYMSPSHERDQSITTEAIIAITEFMSRYPNSRYYNEFQSMLDQLSLRLQEKSYMNAYTYYKIGRYKSAIVAFKNAMKEYPDSPFREDMMYYTTVAAYRLAENSIDSKQLDRYLARLDHYYTFLGDFPESPRTKELERLATHARNFIDKSRSTEGDATY